MDIATMLDATNMLADAEFDANALASILQSINDNIELFIMLFVMFKCLELIKRGFNRLYKGRGV